jgi:hypothetical protein
MADALSIEKVLDKVYKMAIDGGGRNTAFHAYNQMYKSGWDLPPEVRAMPWIQKVVNSDPYDAIQTGVRIISTIAGSIRFQPLAPGAENRARAGKIEKILKWQLKSTNRRRSRTIEAEMGKMALLYDMCALKTVDLEYEIKEKKRLQLDTKEEEDALALGRFMVVPFDSRDVYFEWSNLGLRSVCVIQHRHAHEVVAEWGKKAEQHPALVKLALETHDTDWVTYYDYTDLHTRSVWVEEGRTFSGVPGGSSGTSGRWQLDHGKNPLPFINWAIRGGTDLEADGTHKYQPLLYPVYATGAWDIKNIVQTLGVSEVIAHTGSPKYVETGPNSQQADIDFFSPERIAKMAAGNTLQTLQPIQVDQALQNVEAMLSAQLDKQMVSQVLQGGALPAGIAFATLNLVTQTAIGVLKPAKYLVETVLAEMYTQMLKWAEFTGKDIEGYVVGGDNDGEQLVIESDTLDGKSIYIDVELHPDAPTDRAQKVNTAQIMVTQLGFSQASALDEVGVEDPEEEINKGIFERMVQHEVELELQSEILDMQNQKALELEAERMKMQMAQQQAMMKMQQQAAQQQQQAAQQQQQPQDPGAQQVGQSIPQDLEAPPGALQGGGQQGIPNEAPFAQGAPGENAEGAGFPQEGENIEDVI